jgi:hypothetical protein
MERREKNALRRQKARQKKRNACKREEAESEESEVEMGADIIREGEEDDTTTMLTGRDCGKDVMVDFCPIAW